MANVASIAMEKHNCVCQSKKRRRLFDEDEIDGHAVTCLDEDILMRHAKSSRRFHIHARVWRVIWTVEQQILSVVEKTYGVAHA